jgi:hypothetical protein
MYFGDKLSTTSKMKMKTRGERRTFHGHTSLKTTKHVIKDINEVSLVHVP